MEDCSDGAGRCIATGRLTVRVDIDSSATRREATAAPARAVRKPVVRVEGVTKHYRMGNELVVALNAVNLVIEEGVFLAIAGPSGSGKSTLLNLIGCIDTPSGGRLFLDGENVAERTPDQLAALRARAIGFVFQTFNLFPVLTAA